MAGRNQNSIYELLPKEYHSVDPAGRLDQDSSGALILSNDGDFLYRITHPKFHLPKRYEIRLNDLLTPEAIKKLQTGIKLTPENKLARMTNIKANPKRELCYEVELITGYNRQIRRSLAALGYQVKTLHRISFGPIQLGKLPIGAIRPLTETEKRHLLHNNE
jgi:pseudouridine synthase